MSKGPVRTSPNGPPKLPDGILDELSSRLTKDDAPFLRHLTKQLSLQWADDSDTDWAILGSNLTIMNCFAGED